MPMLLTRRNPHHIAGADFLDGAAPTLHPAEAKCDDQRLDMLGAAEADRAPIMIGVLIALAVLVVLRLIAYAAVRAVGRFTSR